MQSDSREATHEPAYKHHQRASLRIVPNEMNFGSYSEFIKVGKAKS